MLLFVPYFFLYFWLCWVFRVPRVLYLVALSGGYSLVAAYELLIAVASVVTEHQLRVQASVGTVHGLTCPKACGILPDQESNPYPLHWQVDS